MNLKTEFVQKLSLASCLSVAALAAVTVSTAQPAQAQFCVSTGTSNVASTCTQYFANGATFPGLVDRKFFDFYGIAIPTFPDPNGTQVGATGVQPSSPVGSPRNSTVQYNYCLTGSGSGRNVYTGVAAAPTSCLYTASTGGAVVTPSAPGPTAVQQFSVPAGTALFNGTDVPLSATEITNYTNNLLATRGNPIQVPTYFGAIVAGVNAANTTTTSLTTAQLCGIFDGSITSLNGQALTVFIRFDSSGTTNIFTTYLAAACGAGYYLTAGVNTFPTVPQTATFQRRTGNDGVADGIATAGTGGIGYIENAFSNTYTATTISGATSPTALALENPNAPGSAVLPTVRNIQTSLTGTTLTANPTYTCVLTVSGVPVVPTSSTAYPLVGNTYVLTYSRYPSTTQLSAVTGLFRTLLGNRSTTNVPSATDAVAQSLGYVVLYSGTGGSASNTVRAQARNCILTATSP